MKIDQKLRIKILFILPDFKVGGAERVTMNILRGLDPNLYHVHLGVVNNEGSLMKNIPKSVKVIDFKSGKTIFSIFDIRKSILSLTPDILFSTLFRTHIATHLALIGVKIKPKLVLRCPTSPVRMQNKIVFRMLYKYPLRGAYNRADIIVAQTDEMKKELIKIDGVNSKKIRTIFNPIDKNHIGNSISEEQNPLDSQKINVVAAGRLNRVKGFDFLIKSFKKVVQKNSNFCLHILGDDDGEMNDLKLLIKHLHLDHNVFLLGHKDNPYNYFHHSDLFVLASRSEGLPNVILENIFLDKPIISTKCAGILKSIIEEGVNGFLIDFGDEDSLCKAILEYKKIDLSKSKKEIFSEKSNNSFDNLFLGLKV